MEGTQNINELREEFRMLTKDFDWQAWYEVRTPFYWISDEAKSEQQRLEWKLNCIRHYVNKGTVLN